MKLVVSPLRDEDLPVEMVERKGLGHPDSICDALAETLSRNLCRHYLEHFGTILHHNVDKALLCGGRAAPAFGGGEVLAPMDLYLSGRAVAEVGGATVPLDDIVIEGSRTWLRANLHALDAERQVRLHNVVRPGSRALGELFARGTAHRRGVPLANDTSFGVGYAPMTALEQLVLEIEQRINGRPRATRHPAWGEDIKVMGVRHGRAVHLTIACALIGRHLADLDAYRAETDAIRQAVAELASDYNFEQCRIAVNAADDPASGSVYLTVTGTSAESGDDGEVGRGNRVNGLITPCRPMSLEAAAGKNPVSHVGKIYNVLARHIAETIVAEMPEVAEAHCYLVSRIGSPVTEPAIAHVRLATHDGMPLEPLQRRAGEIVGSELLGIPSWIDRFVAGTIDVF
ncbi:MAG: methionine adenosyltransferase [Reyranella sp.]|nr:methionine adenosyltransferase [Reyranella sp.]